LKKTYIYNINECSLETFFREGDVNLFKREARLVATGENLAYFREAPPSPQ